MKKVYNCFCKKSTFGFGDFLRGSIHLYERLKNSNIDFDIDLSLHPINRFIEKESVLNCKEEDVYLIEPTKKQKNIVDSYQEVDDALTKTFDKLIANKIKLISTNYHYLLKLDSPSVIPSLYDEVLTEDCKRFFKKRLQFNKKINEKAEKIVENLFGGFTVIHFRLGDKSSFIKEGVSFNKLWTPDYNDCWLECLDIYNNNIEKGIHDCIIVMADSNELKEYIEKMAEENFLPFVIVHTKSNHTQEKTSTSEDHKLKIKEENIFNTVLDLKLLTMASKVYSFSVYFWGSGFVTWICKIFDVPLVISPLVDKERYLN